MTTISDARASKLEPSAVRGIATHCGWEVCGDLSPSWHRSK